MEKGMIKTIIKEQEERINKITEDAIDRDVMKGMGGGKNTGNHAVIITGIRRCGKSTFMNLMRGRHGNGMSYFFNFEDERLLNFNSSDLNTLFECLLELYGDRKFFFLDEIQNIKGWEPFVRRQQDSGYKFYITGSNASLLSRELGTKLTGRNVRMELYPFSFGEYLKFNNAGFENKEVLTTKKKAVLKRHFNKWLKHGGMPEYLKYNDENMLKHVYEDILYRDIAVRYRIKNVKALRELSLYLISNIGREFSYNSAAKLLGLGSMNTVKNFTDYLENSYLIFVLSKFSHSLKKQFSSEKKVYCIDNGIASSVAFGSSEDKGRYLENVVFMEFKRRGKDVFFFKTQKGKEVDFITKEKNNVFDLFQVCFQMTDKKTREREIRALEEAMKELSLKRSFIITDDHEEIIKTDSGKITAIPAYKWMLGLSDIPAF